MKTTLETLIEILKQVDGDTREEIMDIAIYADPEYPLYDLTIKDIDEVTARFMLLQILDKKTMQGENIEWIHKIIHRSLQI